LSACSWSALIAATIFRWAKASRAISRTFSSAANAARPGAGVMDCPEAAAVAVVAGRTGDGEESDPEDGGAVMLMDAWMALLAVDTGATTSASTGRTPASLPGCPASR